MRLAAVFAILFIALHAEAAEPTPSEREAARTLLISGREKKSSGKLREALADFEKAHAIMHVPTTGLDLGKTQMALGMLVEARATLLEAAHFPEGASEPTAFTKARKEAKDLADEILPKLATLTLSVSPGATTRMDDADLSAASVGAPLKVNPGKHDIVATLNGETKKVSVDLAAGEKRAVDLQVTTAASQPPPVAKPLATEEPKISTTNPLTWVGGGIVLVGLGVGLSTGFLSMDIRSSLESSCAGGTRCPPDTHADVDRGSTLATVSTIGFVAALIGGGILIYGLLNPKTTTTASAAWR